MTTFFVEFEMANVFDFSVIGATRSLLITHWIGDYTNEGEYDAGAGGFLSEGSELRRVIEIELWRISRSPEDPFPDGQDVDDWEGFLEDWNAHEYHRISDTNAVEYVNFSRPTLPIEVVSDFDYKTKLNGKKTAKNITAQFIATEWA
jgi:hypothetical protein